MGEDPPVQRGRQRRLRWGISALVVLLGCSGGPTSIEMAFTPTSTTTVASTEPPSTTTSAPPTTAVPTTTTVATTTTTTIPDRTWTLLAGGDVLMDRSEAAGIDPFVGIVPALGSADIAVVNVEMAISDRGVPVQKAFTFRAPPSAADTIAGAGIDVANLANNHARDFGADALNDTVAHLTERGLTVTGAGADASEAYIHRTIEVGDIAVAFVGASDIVPGGFTATSDRAGIASDRARILANVEVAARNNDVVIVSIHWGIERDTCPSGRQRSYAQDLLAAGADVVLGHHPHVLQPVVEDDGSVVAYSLGNFIWHARSGITGDTGVLQIDFDGDAVVGHRFHPHVLDGAGAPVPIESGSRFDRINDIVSGDCARHDPPPITTSTAPPATTTAPATTAPSTTAPATTVPATTVPSTTAVPSTTVPSTTAAPTTTSAADGG